MTDHAELLPTESTPHRRPGSSPGRREPACLHELFEECAARTPSAVALSHGSVEVPYGELDRRAERLARHLRGLGVGPECLVGLCSERSVGTVVAILAVLKAGGAYLPLDPDYPEERIRFMWEDSRSIPPPGSPSVLLAPAALAERLEPLAAATGSRLVFLDDEVGDGDDTLPSPISSRSSSRSLAYVIYTSGSTGRPKGVMIEHRGVVNVVRHAARVLRVERGSRLLQLASLSFDASVLEIFTALTSGARLVLTPRETLLSGEALGEELRRRAIHTLAIPPSLLDRIPDGVELPALRSIVVGGEACSAATARRWASGRVFVNAYAPTEATIYTTAGTCHGPFDRPPSMGRPIAGTAVRVLDEEGRPVPDGGIGELCLGGLGLARGYGGRAALTAERFVPCGPTGEGAEAGSRLYRSGDLGRRLPDGSLEFAGRADHQVKVRGLRIELGEIEAHLVAFPGVRQAVVVRREDSPGEPRLVGYVVPDPGAHPPVSELRSFLAERLPEAMVPSAFVTLDGFPRTPTGKIDRRALPAPGPERPDLATAYTPPEGPLETALAALWADLLGLERVGAEDDLFELGGHSLVVAQLVNRVRQELGLELPLLAPFEHPTVRGLAAHLASLVEGGGAQEAAAGDLAGPVASAAHRLPPLEPVPRDRPIPVSFPQERIWFLLQLAPRSIAYNFQFSLRFRGELSVPALAEALGELVRRHEILRTTFPAEDGRPVQRIHPPFAARVPVVDLSGVADADGERRREGLLRDLIRAEVRRGFDVTRLPLLRWTLFRLGPDDHLLLQVEHHFVHDGWSLAVYLRELETLYTAYRDGRSSPLPEPAAQYADFAAWQRRFMQGEALEEQLGFWRRKLADSSPLLELPTDRPRPRTHSFRGGCLRVNLNPELYREVRAFSRRRSTTLFMTMLAAFETLLHRYTGERDMLLGSGLANRRLRETEELVGMVVNTLVVRSSLDEAMPFRELLEQVRRTTLELHLYQDLPFEKLVERLQPDRDLSRNPLFQVLFSFHDAPVPDLDLPGLETELFEWHNGSAKTDLNVVVKPVAEQRVGRRARAGDEVLTMVWEYSGDLFDRSTVERMWGHYRNLLAAVVEDPERPLTRLPLLSAAERHELLVEWNDTAVPDPPYPRRRSIPELFEAVARRRPDAVALRQGERWWSYGELERRSARAAERLAAAGVGPETLVGLSAERSPEMVAGLLGILRAGGAYLPLDPSYPEERLAFMLEDARVPVLLASDDLPGRLPAVPGGDCGCVGSPRRLSLEEAVAPDGAGGAVAPPAARSGPRSLAYALYTSGSTGRPKGVAVEHRSVVRLVRGASFAALGEDEVLLQLAPVPFDASTLEIWGALLNGARLEVFPRGTPSLAELARGIETSRVTTLWLTAGLFHQMVEAELPRLAGVRQLLAGGDVLSPPHVARVRSALGPGQALVNGYGPTENTTFTCCHRMGPAAGADAPEGGAGGAVPVGRPISSTRVHLVAPGPGGGLEPVPPGVPGELLAGGDGVARGYLARPALTGAAFVPDPFGAAEDRAPGARLYRTGDLARWLPGGEVEFLGRIDGQVKLRGFRIELGEIEAALQELPEVAEAVVAGRGGPGSGAHGSPATDRRLVAYLVPRQPLEPAGAEADGDLDPLRLRRALEARLPDYMVPAHFVVLESLPLSPTGKVDRRSLPEPERAPALEADDARPGTPTEELVAGLWQQVLGVEEVGMDEDFFQAGGHSLLATRLLARLRAAIGVEIPLADLFDAPTVAGLARRVEARLRSPAEAPEAGGPREATAAIPPRPESGPAPLSFAQERLWFLDRLAPGDASYNIARAFRLEGLLDAAALRGALAAVARRHEVLRTRFDERAGRPVQVVDLPPPALPIVDLRALGSRAEAEAEALGRAESRRPFDLARGPLARAALLRLGARHHDLLLTLHHAAADGGSLAVLLRELGAGYRRRATGAGPTPPPLPVQYADFAVWQRNHLTGDRLETLLGYWRERLAGAPPTLELPADRPRPRRLSGRGARQARTLEPSVPTGVAELALRRGATPFLVYLAAFAALLHRYTGRADLVVGTPMANRPWPEVEELIGFFANSLVLRLDAGGDPPFEELLARTRTAVLGAHAHQEIPFEKLVEELAPPRDLSRTPLFQIMFVVEEGGAEAPDLAGLETRRLDLERAEAKFDLTLALAPGRAGLQAWTQYSTDLFDATRMLRFLDHLGHLLEAAVARPERPLSRLPLLGPAERLQVLTEWNDTGGPAPDPVPLSVLLADQGARTPDAVALSFEGACLTYGELHRLAGLWARRLRALGVGPDALVGVFLERSLEMMVALLAVLEAGGAYVPLDPSYPAGRLAFMLEDSGARVVLTQEHLRDLLPGAPEGGERSVLRLDLKWDLEADLQAGPDDGTASPAVAESLPPDPLGPHHLAYTIYTSGSTGRPKGAMNTHRAVVNRLLWMRDEYGIGPGDRVLQKTPVSFDVSVWELFLPLLVGARLVLARPEGHRDPAYLAEVVRREGITTLHFVPSMLQVFLGQPGVEACSSLHRVIASGEALPASLVAAFNRRLACPLHNLYGPTEAAVDVTSWPCPPAGEPAVVPIGRPIAGTRVHLVEPSFEPVPLGLPGELVIGGVAPGRGYLARPGLTAERFVADPLGGRPGGRLYRTGDLCRTLPSGEIEYLGRLDFQVKVRGHRIEIGEIEAALQARPAVREAVVVARSGSGDSAGAALQTTLVAYVTPAEGAEPRPEELREALRRSLPEPMVPSAVVVLEELPLSPAGKADRAALARRPPPEAGAEPVPEAPPRVQPRNALERALARLWTEVLELDEVGVHDDFFALGGNSITGAVLINRLQETLGEIVHVVVLFDAPTVAGLAEHLQEHYPEAVARRWGGGLVHDAAPGPARAPEAPVTEADVEALRRALPALPPLSAEGSAEPANRPAVFVLAPYRSGSTLLRVMLAGHPRLFAPPELELLRFGTLAERHRAFRGRYRFYLEGAVRAVMEVHGVGAEEAQVLLDGLTADGLTVPAFYRRLQEWLGDRILVDKTPSYALDPETLRRAEAWFDGARYVHLVRHPAAVADSFEEARLDQVVFPWEHPFSRRHLGELIWLLSHRNIRSFLEGIPAERRTEVAFEELVRKPEGVLRRLCDFLELDYHPAMEEPYDGASHRMTDGIHPESRMVGDVKFHRHRGIDPETADRWRVRVSADTLGEATRRLAGALGYEVPEPTPGRTAPALERLPRPAGDRPASFAPSFAQERLWFLDRLVPGSSFYNIPAHARLTGELDRPLLARVLGEIARRHEALRTVLPESEGAPVQRVEPPRPVPLPVVDLAALGPAIREREARRIARTEAERPFDLSRGPLVRARLVDLGSVPEDPGPAREHRLLLTLHHIVSDGWSLGLFLDELSTLYSALSVGEPSPLAELPVQYADFAAWQRRWLAGEVLEGQLAYWRERLAEAPAALELPTDRPRPTVPGFRGDRVPFRLGPDAVAALAALGRASGATPFMVLLAGFKALLARHSGQRDLVVGSPVAGRNRREVEGLIGFFVNTLALRTDLSGDPGFEEVVAAVRRAAVGAFGHQDVPFERLVQEVVPERSLGHAPLFQVLFALQNVSPRSRDLPGLTLEVLDTELRAAKFDLVLSLGETAGGIRGSFQFDADLFDRSTVARLARHYQTLLAAVLEEPAQPLSRLPLLSPAERHELLVEWNDTAVAYPRDRSIPDLFEALARRRPDAVALRQGDRWWSYGELERRSARVAARLAAAGVGPETLVGLSAERSPEMVVGLLGILRAGGAYLPLDPSYPEERLAFMVEDARAPVLVASEAVADRLPGPGTGSGPRVLFLEAGVAADDPDAARPRAGLPASRSGPRSLAYTVYTSGSTGRPKGVAVEHRSVVRLVRGADYAALGEDEVFFQLAPVPFDASTFEVWGALLNGGRLELPAPGVPSLAELGRELEASRVTALFLTTGLFNQMVDAELPRLSSVRQILTGGEVASGPHMARMRETRGSGQVLVHVYGPTEGTTFTTSLRLEGIPRETDRRQPLSIGSPISSTRVYLADPTSEGGLEPVPLGVPGELLAGGDGVARGYLARPSLTAAAFVPDPFGTPGARLYRTGDLARWLPGGVVEFLGRIDGQVKLRGFRIELGEVEATLTGHPAVRRAVAIVREDRPGDRRLVAYAVPWEPAALEPGELRSHLADRLPEHMVPGAFVLLGDLPLDPNGKVNRKALPAPEEGALPARERVAPRTPLEELVAGVWAEVLGIASLGVHDDFFGLGGHSLLATRAVSRLADLTGVEVPLRRLFETPTVAGLAASVEELLGGDAAPRPLPLRRRRDPGRPAPASYAQERLWFLDRFDPGTTAYNLPAVFRFRGALRVPLLARALSAVVRRHEALRTVFLDVDGSPFQRVVPAPPLALPWIDLAGLPRETAEREAVRVAGRSARQAFDLSAGPLFSAWLLRLSDREHRLAWCVHHIAADGWSLGILLRELTALYDAWGRGLPSPLGEPPVQYADFAAWQRRTLGSGALDEQLDYWRRRLDGAPRELHLPTDRPRPQAQTFRGGRARRTLSPDLHDRLHALAAGEGATLFMLLLAALDSVLARWSGQRDVLVGSPVAGRGRSEVEDLVGMFLNTLVLRLDLSPGGEGEPTFRELLGRAREAALGAYTHQDVQFEMLLEALEVERELSRTPLFQVFLNVANFPRETVPLEGLEVDVHDGGGKVESKFDLTLYASPVDGGLTFNLVYNRDLFDPARMEELLDQLQVLLAQVADDPDRPYTDYDLRTPAAGSVLPDPRTVLSDRWEGTVDDVFRARAAESPDRVAVVGDGVAWSYGALDRAAAGLARKLAEAGVVRGDRAAIFAQRSPELAVAVLGVLRAGAAFVLLDPAHPPRHLVEIVERSRPRAVIRLRSAGPVPEALAEAFARLGPAVDLELSRLEAATAAASLPERSPAPPLGPDDLACVTFTSGTTGVPKGIAGRQGSLSHFIPWQTKHLELRPDDRYSMLSGLAHDPLQRDLFTPLQTGATLCVPPPEHVLRPAALWAWMERERVSVAHLTPAMGQILASGADEGGSGGLEAWRRAFFVGEELSPVVVDELTRRAPQLVCWNSYGTTETQRAVGYFPVPPGAARRFRMGLPLGRGGDGVQLLVLGPDDRLAGVAELGEIAVRSPHLARGYLEDPALTAARFTPDPCASTGGRIYRTGDLGRYRPDGAVEFSARVDDQVQVRGFRVELGAIEIALAEHPEVAEAAVAVRSGPGGETLVGYVVPVLGAPAPPAGDVLRSYLAERLPAYMVPGAFVRLDALPLGPTSKVDRRALPDPDDAVEAEGFTPPTTPVEELIAGIWREILRTDRVGANDDFFALGGHSLLATRVVSRLRAEIGLELPLRTLFERPRLRDLAVAVENLLLAEEGAEVSGRP